MPPPDWLANQLMAESKNWQAYPRAFADQAFLDDLSVYFQTRFPDIAGQFDMDEHIIPVLARASLHLLGYCEGAKQDSIAWLRSILSRLACWGANGWGDILYMNAAAQDDFLPSLGSLDEDVLARCTILYLCGPSNPHGKLPLLIISPMPFSLPASLIFFLLLMNAMLISGPDLSGECAK